VAKDTDTKILKKLKAIEKEEGSLPLLLEFYRKLLEIQVQVTNRLGIPQPHLQKKDIDEQIRQGLPILRFEDMDLDLPLLKKTFVEVTAVFQAYPGLFGDITPTMVPEFTEKLVEAWYKGNTLPDVAAVSERLVQAMLQATMNPFLKRYSQVLIGLFDTEFWRRGYCPVCGGRPDFSFLDRERGSRWLICSRCDTEWVFQRLECPFCGNQEQNTLSFLTDDRDMYRLYICERCKCYLKAIDLRKTEAEVLLPLERLYTIDMDKQAQDNIQ
jgi:formate dehydrogenase maturation protein FdhE